MDNSWTTERLHKRVYQGFLKDISEWLHYKAAAFSENFTQGFYPESPYKNKYTCVPWGRHLIGCGGFRKIDLDKLKRC